MFGYIKKDEVLAIIEKQKKENYDWYLFYTDQASKVNVDLGKHCAEVAGRFFDGYCECDYLLRRIKKL